jgi:hypothetical protein
LAAFPAPAPTNHAYTPAKGSPERSAIIAGAKEALTKQGMKDAVLQVTYLKVKRGWAWIQVNPQSANGSQHYESQSGLLQEKPKNWALVEWMPVEDEMDTNSYFTILKTKYPKAPADIYPQ